MNLFGKSLFQLLKKWSDMHSGDISDALSYHSNKYEEDTLI